MQEITVLKYPHFIAQPMLSTGFDASPFAASEVKLRVGFGTRHLLSFDLDKPVGSSTFIIPYVDVAGC